MLRRLCKGQGSVCRYELFFSALQNKCFDFVLLPILRTSYSCSLSHTKTQVSNLRVAKFQPQVSLAVSSSFPLSTCPLCSSCAPPQILKCPVGRRGLRSYHHTWLSDYLCLLSCNCIPRNRLFYDRGSRMAWKCHFCKLLPARCVLLRRNMN